MLGLRRTVSFALRWRRAALACILKIYLHLLSKRERALSPSKRTKAIFAFWVAMLAFVYAGLPFTAYSTWSPTMKIAELVDKLPFVAMSGVTVVNWVLDILVVLFYIFLAVFVLACFLILWSICRDIFGVEQSKDKYHDRVAKTRAKIHQLEKQKGETSRK